MTHFASKSLIVTVLLFLFLNCSSRNVYLRPYLEETETDKLNSMKVGFDRMGNIYPKEEPANESSFRNNQIEEKFEEEKMQDQVKELNRRKGNKKDIAVFIHGIEPEKQIVWKNYSELKTYFQQGNSNNNSTFFLEVYWDGMQEHFPPYWKSAQMNSFYAGKSLGKFLRKISDSNSNIHIITHSRGASVGSYALWDVSLLKEDEPSKCTTFLKMSWCSEIGDEELKSINEKKKLDQFTAKSVQLGFIAPAMGRKYFDDASHSNKKIIIGINEKDRALNKIITMFQTSKVAGDTSLGAVKKEACEAQKKIPGIKIIDFRQSEANKKAGISEDSHEFIDYIRREQFSNTFLPLLKGEKSKKDEFIVKCDTDEKSLPMTHEK